MRWTAAEIAAAVGGEVIAYGPSDIAEAVAATVVGDQPGVAHVEAGDNVVIRAVTQDSREIAAPDAEGAGHLFVPLIAERDGHDFIRGARDAGAVATLADRDIGSMGLSVIRVADTGDALTALGRAARARLESATVVGITGSVGKTTTKDLVASVLRRARHTHANPRSFNNEIGVPLTLLAAPENAEVVVLELGARGVGHIAELCTVARPTVGVVTTVGGAHTSEFGSLNAVADGKGELVEALPSADDGGLAVLNADVDLVAAMATRTHARVVTFGATGDVRAEGVSLDDELVPRFRLVSEWGSAEVVLGARGIHLVPNALAAAATALPLGLAIDDVVAGLTKPMLSPMRMSLEQAPSGARILNDSYNANPMSTEAALRSLAALPAERRVAVLGLMAELGDESEEEHQRMMAVAAELGIPVIAVATPEYGEDATHVEGIEEAAQTLGDLTEADAVLVKGSRVAALEGLVTKLFR